MANHSKDKLEERRDRAYERRLIVLPSYVEVSLSRASALPTSAYYRKSGSKKVKGVLK